MTRVRTSTDLYRAVEPGRNSPCLCGSGRKFKKCCGPGYCREREKTAAFDALRAEEFEKALDFARLDLVRYIIWHRAHTIPWHERSPEAAAPLLDLDLNALGDLVDLLRHCYTKAGRDTEFPAVLDRLRGVLEYPRWEQRLRFQRALTAMQPDWNEEAGRDVLSGWVDPSDLEDFEFASLLLDLFGDRMGVAEQLRFIEKVIELSRTRSETFQYEVLRGIVFILIGDAKEGAKAINAALERFDGVPVAQHELHELRLHAQALLHLPDHNRPKDGLELARALLREGLSSGELSDSGRAHFQALLGESYIAEDQYQEAIGHLEESVRLSSDFAATLSLVRARSRTGDTAAAKELLSSINYTQLNLGEQFDHTIAMAELAESAADEELLRVALSRLREVNPRFPVHRELATELLGHLSAIQVSSEPARQPSFWRKLLAKYLVLQPNVFGFGINLNALLEEAHSTDGVTPGA